MGWLSIICLEIEGMAYFLNCNLVGIHGNIECINRQNINVLYFPMMIYLMTPQQSTEQLTIRSCSGMLYLVS